MLPRRFALIRGVDHDGVARVDVVAFGVAFADGQVVLRWCSAHPATSNWNSLDDMLAVHGLGRGADLQWIDPPATDVEDFSPAAGPGRRARRQAAALSERESAPVTAVADPSPNGFPWPLETTETPADEPAAPPPRQPGRHRRAGQVDQSV
jgi:hypothetical protein